MARKGDKKETVYLAEWKYRIDESWGAMEEEGWDPLLFWSKQAAQWYIDNECSDEYEEYRVVPYVKKSRLNAALKEIERLKKQI